MRAQSASRRRSGSNLRTVPRAAENESSKGQPPHPQPFSPGKPGGEGSRKDSIATGKFAIRRAQRFSSAALKLLYRAQLDEPEPDENDDWVVSMRDDRPMGAACDEVFAACDNNWSQDSVGWRAPPRPRRESRGIGVGGVVFSV